MSSRLVISLAALILAGPLFAPGAFAQGRSEAIQRGGDARGAGYRDVDDRDRYLRRVPLRNDRATLVGWDDGYEAGLKDARARRRFDPVGESRYRHGDRGYDRRYGPRELYRLRYRDAFRTAYERGYLDGRRRVTGRLIGPPWWW